jgi:DNA modification methylase
MQQMSPRFSAAQPHLMVTDPPWGVEYDATHRRALQSLNSRPAQGAVLNDDNADWREAWALFKGNVAYVWHSGTKAVVVAASLMECGFEIRTQIIWGKIKFVVGRGHYHVQHEPCWYAVRDHGHWQGDRTQSTLWTIEHRKSETGHSTQKPVECMKRPIENNSQPGDGVYDPFVGSGTTIIAAEMTARRCYAIEIDPGYVDCSIERWQNFTGNQATMDGQSFEQIKAERLGKPKRQTSKAKVKAKAATLQMSA